MLRKAEADHQLAAVFSYGWRSADTWEGRTVFLVFHGAQFRARTSHAAASFHSVTTPIPAVALIPHARSKLAIIQFNQTAVTALDRQSGLCRQGRLCIL
jgi:hypothetical protein